MRRPSDTLAARRRGVQWDLPLKEHGIQTLLPEWAYVVPTPHCGNAETARDGTYASAAASGRMPR